MSDRLKKLLPGFIILMLFTSIWVYSQSLGPSGIEGFSWINGTKGAIGTVYTDDLWVADTNVTDNVLNPPAGGDVNNSAISPTNVDASGWVDASDGFFIDGVNMTDDFLAGGDFGGASGAEPIYDAVIWKSGADYYWEEEDGTNYSDTNAHKIFNWCIGNQSGGGYIFVKEGSYTVTDSIVIDISGIKIIGAGSNLVSISYTDATDDMFYKDTDGYSTSSDALTVTSNDGDTTITVADGTGYDAGDYIKVVADNILRATSYKAGEIVQVKSRAGNVITVAHGLLEDYTTTGAGSHIREVTFLEDLEISGMSVTGPGEEQASYFIGINLWKHVMIRDVKLYSWGGGITFRDCLDVDIYDCVFDTIFRTGYGYSVSISNACDDINIIDCQFLNKGRHYITASAGSGTYTFGGYPRTVRIHQCYFEASTDEAINTHAQAYGPLVITECTFYDCEKGIEIQDAHAYIGQNTFHHGTTAIYMYCPETTDTFIQIEGNEIHHTRIYLRYNARVKINDNQIYNSWIWIGASGYEDIYYPEIMGNTFYLDKGVRAIYLHGESANRVWYAKIADNNIYDYAGQMGIQAVYADYGDFSGNTFNDVATGVDVTSSVNVKIHDNRVYDAGTGVKLTTSNYASISGNVFDSCSSDGIWVDGDDVGVLSNYFYDCADGVDHIDGTNVSYIGNVFVECPEALELNDADVVTAHIGQNSFINCGTNINDAGATSIVYEEAGVGIEKAGSLVGTQPHINFIEGANVTITVTDDSANNEVDVTISSSGGGAGGTGGRGAYDAIVYKSGATYYAVDPTGGSITNSANFSAVMNTVIASYQHVFIDSGQYEITHSVDFTGLDRRVIEGSGVTTHIYIADSRPTGAGDWDQSCVFLTTGGATDVTLKNMRINGNGADANQSRARTGTSYAPICIKGSNERVNCENLYVHDGRVYGIFYDANSGTIQDCKVVNCVVTGSGYNDISLQSGTGTVRDCVVIGCTAGGNTGDIAIDTETWSGGTCENIGIFDCTILDMFGTDGSASKGWKGIGFERGATNCIADGNTVYESALGGIWVHPQSTGPITISNNVIYVEDSDATYENKGIHCEDGPVIVTGNQVIGSDMANTYGIYLRDDSGGVCDDSIVSNNYVVDFPTGFSMTGGDDCIIMGNRFVSCTNPITGSGSRNMFSLNNWSGCTNNATMTSYTAELLTSNVATNGRWWSDGDNPS